MAQRSTKSKKDGSPRILLWDLETSPCLGYVWSLWDQNVALNQLHSDWFILSYSAKWLDDPATKIMYKDQRDAKDIEDDTPLLKDLWKLLDEADIVVTQNGKSFDQKKLFARFVLKGFKKPSPFKHIDTKRLASKHFGFTSNKLEYLTNNLNVKYKKLTHSKFSGFTMWRECLSGNLEAWKEMEKYNKYDVLSLEELYKKLIPWDSAVNFTLYANSKKSHVCSCGSKDAGPRGYYYTNTGKFQRYCCNNCGAWTRSRVNLFDDDTKTRLRAGI